MYKYVITIITSMFLISCGFKGPLYLPKSTLEPFTHKNASDAIHNDNIESSL